MFLVSADKIMFRTLLSVKKIWGLILVLFLLVGSSGFNFNAVINSIYGFNQPSPGGNFQGLHAILGIPFFDFQDFNQPKNVTSDKNTPLDSTSITNPNSIVTNSVINSELFAIPSGFEDRVKFWTQVYSKYTSEDAIFHDSQNLGIVYKVVDLRPITQSNMHPFVKEHKIKHLIKSERKALFAQLQSLKKKLNKKSLTDQEQALFKLLSEPKKKSQVAEAIENLRMQQGQKDFVEKALMSSDYYLPKMEEIFVSKGLPKELTRIPFVESSFNLAARSRVGASGIWQIMPATGRKLMPNSLVDYRNDPIKATEFAVTLLKFNFKVIDTWPLAITAYNHGPTSIKKIAKKYKTTDLAEIVRKAYGSHAFAFASSNFYACFLAMLEVEKNRATYFPEVPRNSPLAFSTIQLKKSISYEKLLSWFNKDSEKADQLNPHLASSIKKGRAKIPSGTVLYIPENITDLAIQDFPHLARRI